MESMGVAIVGWGDIHYTIIYVEDINTLYKSIVRNPTRGSDAPRRVSTRGTYTSGIFIIHMWGIYCCP